MQAHELATFIALSATIAILFAFIVVTFYGIFSEMFMKRRNKIDKLCDNARLNTDPRGKARFRYALGMLTKSEYVHKAAFKRSAAAFMKIAVSTPDPVDKAYCLGWAGRCFEDYGDIAVAATCYAAAAAVAPSDVYALERLGDFFWEFDSAESIERYEQLIEYDPLAPRAYYKLGKLHSVRDEPEKAIERYMTAIKVHNGYVAPMAEAAVECAKIGDKANLMKYYYLAMANDVFEFEKLCENIEENLKGAVVHD